MSDEYPIQLLPPQHIIVHPDGTEYPIHRYEWLQVGRPRGLGIPRLTGRDELITERGARQHGSTAVILRLPEIREWELPIKIQRGSPDRLAKTFNDELVNIFNPWHNAEGTFDIPVPFTYKYVDSAADYVPGIGMVQREYYIDFFCVAGLDAPDLEGDDGRYAEFTLQMQSPSVVLYKGQESGNIEAGWFSIYNDGDVTTYRRGVNGENYTGSWYTAPLITFDINTTPTPLNDILAFGFSDGGGFPLWKAANYPTGGFDALKDAALANKQFYFDVGNRLVYTDQPANTAAGAVAGGGTVVTCTVSVALYTIGTTVEIELDSGSIHSATVTNLNIGLKQITFSPGIPSGETVSIGNDVIGESVNLANDSLPTNNWEWFRMQPGREYKIIVQVTSGGSQPFIVPDTLLFTPKVIGIFT